MCTVSFVKVNDKVIITSNRDEKVLRPSAVEPQYYLVNHKKVLFPKDNKAGGTWYAVDEQSNVLVLLNGAEERHTVKERYRKSRGLIVLDLIGSNSPIAAWETIGLVGIEPFTVVLFENQKLYQLRWNEITKEKKELDTDKAHIWSSSTLYSPAIQFQRALWFHAFMNTNLAVNEKELLHFHRYTEAENKEHGLVINRNDTLKTLSITQTIIESNKVTNHYADLIKEQDHSSTFITV